MTLAMRWPVHRRSILQLGSVGLCCAAALAIHGLVDADVLGDAQELALNATGVGLLVVAFTAATFGLRRIERRGARVARAVLGAALVVLAGGYAWSIYPSISIELAGLLAPAQATEPPTLIVLGPDGHDIRISGDIREGAAARLSALLDRHPGVTRVALTSEGGLADEGEALGDVIAAHMLTTYVPDFCVSACTLAFAGGHERLLMEGARLGYHAPYEQGVLGATFAGDASDVRDAYLKAGLAPAFVEEALKVAAGDMWFPEPDELLESHAVTGYVDRYRFPDSMLDGAASVIGARDVILRNFPALRAYRLAAPRALDRIAAWYLAAYRSDGSEGDDVAGLKTIVRNAVSLTLAQADDATLVDVARYLQNAMAAAGPDACVAIGRTPDLLAAETRLDRTGSTTADTTAATLLSHAVAAGSLKIATPLLPVALSGPDNESCGHLRSIYADIVRRRDPSALRRRLAAHMRQSAMVLASVFD